MFILHFIVALPLMSVAQHLAVHHLYGIYAGTPGFDNITNFANAVEGFVKGLGITVFIIGVVIAGMMRVMSFGSDRRVAISNMALTAAIVGLIIMLMADTLVNLLKTYF